MNRKRLFDSFAILAYLNRESGFETVRDFLAESQKSGNLILMNEINIGEIYYILHRKRGSEEADYFINTILEGLPILPVSNDFGSTIDAARMKAEYPISFADCFAVATARHENAILVTGDPEFKQVEHLLQIEWIR